MERGMDWSSWPKQIVLRPAEEIPKLMEQRNTEVRHTNNRIKGGHSRKPFEKLDEGENAEESVTWETDSQSDKHELSCNCTVAGGRNLGGALGPDDFAGGLDSPSDPLNLLHLPGNGRRGDPTAQARGQCSRKT